MLHPGGAGGAGGPFRRRRRTAQELQSDKLRERQGPRIQAAQQRADDAHVRETNLAVDAAHTAAEEAKTRIGNPAIDFVQSGGLDDGSLINAKYADSSVNARVLAAASVGNNELGSKVVSTGKLADLSVGFGQIADGAVAPQKLDRDYVEPGQTGTTTAGGTAHSHSMSSTVFIKKPRNERMRMLNDRLDLEEVLRKPIYEGTVEHLLARNIHNLLTLLMDYRGFNAYQREKALVDPETSEWAEKYKRVYGVDEYAEDDRKNFLAYPDVGVRMDPYEGIAPANA